MRRVWSAGLIALGILALLAVHIQLTNAQAFSTALVEDEIGPADVPTDPGEPTQPPTEEPTQPPTEEPTQPPTEEPTQPPPDQPTTPPTQPPGDDDDDDDDRSDPILSKRVNTTIAQVGDVLAYELIVTVEGNRTARDVVVEDTVPPFFELVNATTTRGQIVIDGATVRAEIGSVSPDETITVRIIVRVIDVPADGTYTNTARLTTSTTTDRSDNNTARTTVTFTGPRPQPTATPTLTTEPISPTQELLVTPLPVTATATTTAAPVPIPATLPETGAAGGGSVLPLVLLLILGLGALGLGIGVSRRNTR